MAFACPIKLCLSQPMGFPAFTFPIVSLIPLIAEWLCGAWLLDGVKPQWQVIALSAMVPVNVETIVMTYYYRTPEPVLTTQAFRKKGSQMAIFPINTEVTRGEGRTEEREKE